MGNKFGICVSATLVFLLLLGAFFVVVPGTAVADQDGDYTFTVSSDVATITGYTGSGGAITIPSTLGGYPVVAIDNYAFNSAHLTSVTIPDSVISIGVYAFGACTNLTSVIIPNSVTYIGNGAFSSCSSLTSVAIPDSVTLISYSTFDGCTSLTSVNIGTGVTDIRRAAFQSCTSLTSVTIPDSVTYIDEGVFAHCTSLTAIKVNAGNPGYASIDGVLYNKNATALVQYPGGKTGAFTIPNSVTSIGQDAFYNCISLTSVTIPSSVTYFEAESGAVPFRDCTNLTSIDVNVDNQYFASVDGVLYSKSLTTLLQYPSAKTGAFTIPDSVTIIGSYAFGSCTSLTSVSIGNGVEIIGGYAFDSCTSLASVNIGTNVTSIGQAAFQSCTSLTSITFLGIVPPTSVVSNWIDGTPTEIRGHAYAASNFPDPGGVWNGLKMGSVITAAPAVAPGAPTNPTATPGNAQVVLAWNIPADDGGSPIIVYKLYRSTYRSTTSGGIYSIIASPTALTYTDTGLTNGQTYYYKVSAVNSAGESSLTGEFAATPNVPSPHGGDNTLLYVGIGMVAALAAVGAAAFFMLKKK